MWPLPGWPSWPQEGSVWSPFSTADCTRSQGWSQKLTVPPRRSWRLQGSWPYRGIRRGLALGPTLGGSAQTQRWSGRRYRIWLVHTLEQGEGQDPWCRTWDMDYLVALEDRRAASALSLNDGASSAAIDPKGCRVGYLGPDGRELQDRLLELAYLWVGLGRPARADYTSLLSPLEPNSCSGGHVVVMGDRPFGLSPDRQPGAGAHLAQVAHRTGASRCTRALAGIGSGQVRLALSRLGARCHQARSRFDAMS